MNLEDWYTALWFDYAELTPRVSKLRELLQERGEYVIDDHVAFRTLNVDPIGLDALGAQVEELGYRAFDDYHFAAKKLRARSYVHREDGWPRIFLSELLVEQLPEDAQRVLRDLVATLPPDFALDPTTFYAGRVWRAPTLAEYDELLAHSEYAAWFATWGLRPNHFTVAVNDLDSFSDLDSLLDWVTAQGFALNESGGRVKGSADDLLAQAATLADQIEVAFADGSRVVPSCYYEFALRYPTETGELFDGFVATSADRIFESTDTTGA